MRFDVQKLTGSEFCYYYRELTHAANEEQVQAYCRAVKDRFVPIAKALDEHSNAIWVLRHYLAIKFAMAAAVLSGSAQYALDQNLLLGVPYFNYYALLHCCRSFLLTSPDVEWGGAKTVKMTHGKIINLTSDLMKRLDSELARRCKEQLESARDHRELYSYRFPGGGPTIVDDAAFDPDRAADTGRLIAELAMLNSECFQASLTKHGPQIKQIPEIPDHEWADIYEISGARIIDHEDRYRFRKYLRGWTRVSTLEVMASDGLIEDFYGSWCADEDDNESLFNPDDYTRHILTF